MKAIRQISLLNLLSLLLLACATTNPAPESVWIDVRSKDEYQENRLSDAINIEYSEILAGIEQAGIAKDTEILLYCGSGRRAGIAQQALESAGFTNVINRGGLEDLLEQGLN